MLGTTSSRRRLDVSVQTLRWWRWRQLEEEVEGDGFVRVTTVDDQVPSSPFDSFEVRLPGGSAIIVPAGFDESELSRLIRTLEPRC